jgi:hypothetical protein
MGADDHREHTGPKLLGRRLRDLLHPPTLAASEIAVLHASWHGLLRADGVAGRRRSRLELPAVGEQVTRPALPRDAFCSPRRARSKAHPSIAPSKLSFPPSAVLPASGSTVQLADLAEDLTPQGLVKNAANACRTAGFA